MTLILKTKSHGDIDAGFFAGFMKLSRIGDYDFETKDLCSLAKCIAENPQLKELDISGYDLKEFWILERAYRRTCTDERIKSYLETDEAAFDIFLIKQRELSPEDKSDLMDKHKMFQVQVKRESVRIGKYDIENPHFASMMYYLAHGGFFGWSGETPDYAEDAYLAMKTSKNPIFSGFD